MIEFCGKHGLIIGDMVFPHRDCHKVTWISLDKDKQVENQIDHICISRNWNKSLMGVQNKRGADIGSDHHMIMGILELRYKNLRERLQTERNTT